jgi:hypothetical protein
MIIVHWDDKTDGVLVKAYGRCLKPVVMVPSKDQHYGWSDNIFKKYWI